VSRTRQYWAPRARAPARPSCETKQGRGSACATRGATPPAAPGRRRTPWARPYALHAWMCRCGCLSSPGIASRLPLALACASDDASSDYGAAQRGRGTGPDRSTARDRQSADPLCPQLPLIHAWGECAGRRPSRHGASRDSRTRRRHAAACAVGAGRLADRDHERLAPLPDPRQAGVRRLIPGDAARHEHGPTMPGARPGHQVRASRTICQRVPDRCPPHEQRTETDGRRLSGAVASTTSPGIRARSARPLRRPGRRRLAWRQARRRPSRPRRPRCPPEHRLRLPRDRPAAGPAAVR